MMTILVSSTILAYNPQSEKVRVGDICYELNKDNKTASVMNSSDYYYIVNNLNASWYHNRRDEERAMEKLSYKGDIKIPSAIMHDGQIYEVTEISFRAFEYCKNLRSIIIPNSVKVIEAQAFVGCSGLISVVLPQDLKRIEQQTFWSCSSLTSIQIGNKVQYIGRDAFSNCRSLKTLIVPATVKKIEYNAFEYVNNIIYKGNAEGAPWGANNINKASDY